MGRSIIAKHPTSDPIGGLTATEICRPEPSREVCMTRRFAAAAASIVVLGVAGVASADAPNPPKPYRASRAAVNPAATSAGLATVVGKAQLVDGRKRNKVSLHM